MKVFVTGYLAELSGSSEIVFDLAEEVALPDFFEQFLFANYPTLKLRIFDEKNQLRPHIAIFIETSRLKEVSRHIFVGEESELFILPALSGG